MCISNNVFTLIREGWCLSRSLMCTLILKHSMKFPHPMKFLHTYTWLFSNIFVNIMTLNCFCLFNRMGVSIAFPMDALSKLSKPS